MKCPVRFFTDICFLKRRYSLHEYARMSSGVWIGRTDFLICNMKVYYIICKLVFLVSVLSFHLYSFFFFSQAIDYPHRPQGFIGSHRLWNLHRLHWFELILLLQLWQLVSLNRLKTMTKYDNKKYQAMLPAKSLCELHSSILCQGSHVKTFLC